jgi:hypothetical protein
LAKYALLLNILFIYINLTACSLTTTSTYEKEDVSGAIQDICLKEYNFKVVVKLINDTLWIYLPLKDIIRDFKKEEKPPKYTKLFEIKENKANLKNEKIKIEYLIQPIPEEEKYQEFKYNEEDLKKINNTLNVLRRVVFSMNKQKEKEPKFYSLVIADIKNGIEIREIIYYLDLKKITYGYISWDEFSHRCPTEVNLAFEAINDENGSYLNCYNITMGEFIVKQIIHRIRLKFEKPEVKKDVDIDKEIKKIVVYTLKIYNFINFSEIEFHNLLTHYKTTLNQPAILGISLE